MSSSVVTRFAPSPTGNLHLGGARTALFCWAHARKAGGTYLVRIEDTDRVRSSRQNEEAILAGLDWLGLAPDDIPLRQSERTQIYQDQAQRLIEQGDAYLCFATAEELDALRAEQIARKEKPRYDRRWRDRTDHPAGKPAVVRFASPLEGISFIDDIIRGQVEVKNSELDDPVILRADGTPTYNFACVVDDIACSITDVVRGEDHLSNTLRQQHIVAALGGSKMRYAHLPLIMAAVHDQDGSVKVDEAGNNIYEKMSKRNAAVDVAGYRNEGYLASAMVNYLAQLGWTNPQNEIYDSTQLAELFELNKVHKSAAKFDLDRLRWLNRQHMRMMKPASLAALAKTNAPEAAIDIACEQAYTLAELSAELGYFEGIDADISELLAKYINDENRLALTGLAQALQDLEKFEADAIKKAIKLQAAEHGLKFARLGMPLRVALTGRENTPDVAVVACLLGREQVGLRLAAALDSAAA